MERIGSRVRSMIRCFGLPRHSGFQERAIWAKTKFVSSHHATTRPFFNCTPHSLSSSDSLLKMRLTLCYYSEVRRRVPRVRHGPEPQSLGRVEGLPANSASEKESGRPPWILQFQTFARRGFLTQELAEKASAELITLQPLFFILVPLRFSQDQNSDPSEAAVRSSRATGSD